MKPALSPTARASLISLAIFCVAMAAAMASYAGGSWLHPHALAHSFWENFWCDLLREPAHNGQPNGRSVALGTIGFCALSLALSLFWRDFSGMFRDWRRGFVRTGGLVSAIGTAVVALLPSDRFPVLHAPAVLSAGVLGLACGCICAGWALRHFSEARAFASASVVLISAAVVNLGLYVWVSYLGGADTLVMPAVQKLATAALLAWLVTGLAVSASRPKP